jgi:hypothetical protein
MLVRDAGEQAVIARVRQARAEGLALRVIADALRAEGIVNRAGRPFAVSSLCEMGATDAG